MDLLDRLLGHDVWTTGELLTICSELSDADLDREFDIGHKTVRATLNHIVFNLEIWSSLMAGEAPLVERGQLPHERTVTALVERLGRAGASLASIAREVSSRGGWDETWVDVLDNPPARKTYGNGIAHLVTHSMHHRAQVLYMFRQLGVIDVPEGDVFSWAQHAGVA